MMQMKQFSLDFLWYSYFGITQTDAALHKDDAAICCANRAYRDLCRRIPYKHSASEIEKAKGKYQAYSDNKNSFRAAVCKAIGNAVIEFIANPNGNFDEFHRNASRTIIQISGNYRDLFKENQSLNYGLTQKWLNMAVKNMLVMGLWNESFKPYLSFLHIPLDRYILAAAGGKKDVNHLGIKTEDYFDDYNWSQIPNDERLVENYYLYQKEIRSRVNGNQIEWEHEAWLAESKKNSK